jgi:phage head maturation protease
MKISGPKGWQHDQIIHRFDGSSGNASPLSYDPAGRSCTGILSVGSAVKRIFGTEVLRISPESVDSSRVVKGLVPLLDSHQSTSIKHLLGRVAEIWFDKGALCGRLEFADTEQGRIAEGMVQRGEIAGLSLGYRVERWEISDSENNVIDPERAGWDDDLTYTAVRFQILECSLVCVPADADALIRSLGNSDGEVYRETDRAEGRHDGEVATIIARMQARQLESETRAAKLDEDFEVDVIFARMVSRQSEHDDV